MKTICHARFVGIDVSKEWIDIAIDKESFRVNQTEEELNKIIRDKIKPYKASLCIVESTGGYERLIVTCLEKEKLNVHIAHPSRVRDFAKAKGLLAKTDKLDAHMLSEYGAFIGAEMVTIPLSPSEQKLRDLRARHEQLKQMRHAEACRLQNYIDMGVKKNIQRVFDFLTAELTVLETEIQMLIEQDDELNHRQKILCSMKGVGIKTSQAILIHLPELGKLSRKKIAALVGVAPMTKQSGKKYGRAKIQQGRGNVRCVLYMAALVAARHNPIYKSFYVRLTQAGKPAKVAVVAVMRKMLVTLNAMVRANQAWKIAS